MVAVIVHCCLNCTALVFFFFVVAFLFFCMCVSGQPEAQTSSSVAVTSKYSRGIYRIFIVEGLKANYPVLRHTFGY